MATTSRKAWKDPQLHLQLWMQPTAETLTRIEASQEKLCAGQDRLEANQERLSEDMIGIKAGIRMVLLALDVQKEAAALAIPSEVKPAADKLASARAVLERLERRAS